MKSLFCLDKQNKQTKVEKCIHISGQLSSIRNLRVCLVFRCHLKTGPFKEVVHCSKYQTSLIFRSPLKLPNFYAHINLFSYVLLFRSYSLKFKQDSPQACAKLLLKFENIDNAYLTLSSLHANVYAYFGLVKVCTCEPKCIVTH